MRVTLQPPDELRGLLDETSPQVAAALFRIGKMALRGEDVTDAAAELGRQIAEYMTWADLLARRRAHLYAANVQGTAYAMFGFQIPRVPFLTAIKDFFSRVPEVARKVKDVADVYARHGFAVARAASLEVVKKAHAIIGRSMVEGTSKSSSVEQIAEIGDFSKSYASTVYENGTSSAYTAGTFQEVREPSVRAVIPALAYTVVRDANARPNHLAADGLIAAEDDPIWHVCSPPCGHRCRCGLRYVTAQEAKLRGVTLSDGSIRLATVPTGFFRDPGFKGGRPDVAIYGA